MSRRGRPVAILALGAIAVAFGITAPRSVSLSAAGPSPAPTGPVVNGTPPVVPTTDICREEYGLTCYTPAQIRRAYGLEPLYARGLDGAGVTIAIIVEFGSPTIQQDLTRFDSDFGIPAPPRFQIIQPVGDVPPFDRHDDRMVSFAREATLDVEWAHAMAPGAGILLVETPEVTTSAGSFVNTADAEGYVIDRGLADVVSQSFGWDESLLDKRGLTSLRRAYRNARDRHVTVVASSGDDGSVMYEADGGFYQNPAVSWPASDPLVTGVGGLRLFLDAEGNRLKPDAVWNETFDPNVVSDPPVPWASGGGLSVLFRRPAYQDGVSLVQGGARGVPDISLSAAVDGGVVVYESIPGRATGYHVAGGTSEAAPELAGIVAIADQAAGHPIGELNPLLYELAARHAPGIVDVVSGDNHVQYLQGEIMHAARGWQAVPGYDLASGLGTIDAAKLVPELARLAEHTG